VERTFGEQISWAFGDFLEQVSLLSWVILVWSRFPCFGRFCGRILVALARAFSSILGDFLPLGRVFSADQNFCKGKALF
jgi:hypothetical protein